MRIKIIKDYNCEDLETRVNLWLSQQKDIEVQDVKYQQYDNVVSVVILYKINY